MKSTANFLAIDLGAASGRVVLGRWNDKQFYLNELHRFGNGGISAPGGLYWDVFRLWTEIKAGIAKYAAHNKQPLDGISVSAWGLDFGLLDTSGELLGNPHHYRDARTDGAIERLQEKISLLDLYRRTGVYPSQINTLCQLNSIQNAESSQLKSAASLLMIPDLFHYFLSGEKGTEYTQASTTQVFCAWERSWTADVLDLFSIPQGIFSPVVDSGTVLGSLLPSVAEETGMSGRCPVIAGASHDTASAVAAIPGLDKNTAFLWSGTWSILGVESAEPVTSEQSFVWGFTNEGGVDGSSLLLKNLPGLWLLQECQRYWSKTDCGPTWEELIQLAEHSQPFAFFLDSEARCFLNPVNMPEAIRRYCSETNQLVPENNVVIARGCLENVIFKYRSALDRLERLASRKLTKLRLVGEGVQSKLFCQLTANATGREVIAGPAEAPALGNVMLQAIASGHLPDIHTARESVAASREYSVYYPEDTVRWNDEYHRFFSFISPRADEDAFEIKAETQDRLRR